MTTILGELDAKSVKQKKLVIQDFDTKCPNRNIFVVGGPGSFKSAGYVIPNVIVKNQQSIVVTDPSGELYEKTANIKRMQGYDVRVVNFKNFLASDRQNFFDYIDKDSDASIVAELIIKSAGDSKINRDVWFKSSVGLLNSLILYAKYEFPPEKRNMENVIKFVQNNKPKKESDDGSAELDKRFSELPKDHPARESYEFGFDVSEDRTRSSIVLTFVSDLRNYVDREVRSYTSDSDFDLKDVGKQKTIVYVMLPVLGNSNTALSSLFFSQMFQQLYRLGDDNGAKLPYPVDFLLDEWPNIGAIPDYEETLATCRKYGIGISTIVQSISQVIDKYNKDKANAIIGNHAVILCLGNVNNDTAKYIKEELGNTTVEFETSSEGSSSGKDSRSKSSNKNVSFTGRALLNEDEISNMELDKAVLITKNRNPKIIKKCAYFKMFPDLTEKYLAPQNEYKRKKNASMIERHNKLQKEWDIKQEKLKQKKIEEYKEKERHQKELEEEQNQVNEVSQNKSEITKSEDEETKTVSDTKKSFYDKLKQKQNANKK
ncbi:TPA: type IV secretory system conjugative DNA transfer family protein [Staphylococcus aureus]|uniref:VirD4-like conjugal transfer protein, CD1115 family n=1 Tax=Staphylococcus TaxID=1279 RepID=UPI0009835A0F|nr:type IV secretory system conjugative DNA transfer family protein [Staphylococcus aureus]AQR26660.1 type VI secretion protein [Staphylococcus aureus]AQR53179.1 type VI secretion protein [Staphylococcus aureus]MBO8865149.1 type IV secretory system conjugative DNA transfer family protein [Staphylococcus aureus]CAC9318675.1 transfer complex protein TraK [Staphylococcus aureus]HAR4273690.1 type IV secretory system conjugative DNA transfer family protein [Staphylococcus aureus]